MDPIETIDAIFDMLEHRVRDAKYQGRGRGSDANIVDDNIKSMLDSAKRAVICVALSYQVHNFDVIILPTDDTE